MQSSDQTTDTPVDAAQEPQDYQRIVTVQLHARVKKGSSKRPARTLLGKRTNAILDKHGLRRIIPALESTDTECNDDKYVHYTALITFESDEPSRALELAISDLWSFVDRSARPLFFRTNRVLEYSFRTQQSATVRLNAD